MITRVTAITRDMLLVIMLLISMIVWTAALRIAHGFERQRLIKAGELCVIYNDNMFGWRRYELHWKPTPYDYGPGLSGIFCAKEDYPEAARGRMIGMLGERP